MSIMKGTSMAVSLSVANHTILTVLEELVKGFDQIYDALLADNKTVQLIKETTENCLHAIDSSRHFGKFKRSYLQLMVISKLL